MKKLHFSQGELFSITPAVTGPRGVIVPLLLVLEYFNIPYWFSFLVSLILVTLQSRVTSSQSWFFHTTAEPQPLLPFMTHLIFAKCHFLVRGIHRIDRCIDTYGFGDCEVIIPVPLFSRMLVGPFRAQLFLPTVPSTILFTFFLIFMLPPSFILYHHQS